MAAGSEDGLAGVFADVARRLHAAQSPEKTEDGITRAAVETIPGCDHAALTVVRRGRGPETRAATDDVPARVDAIQYEVGQGPCLEAIREHHSYVTGDLRLDERWPRFSHRVAAETGVRSMLAFRLFVRDQTIGALNLYSRSVDAFDEYDQAVGAVLAAHAAIALVGAWDQERAENLEEALQTSREIGMAMGVLMARGSMSQEKAFGMLTEVSQRRNVKLRDVAADIVAGFPPSGRSEPLAPR